MFTITVREVSVCSHLCSPVTAREVSVCSHLCSPVTVREVERLKKEVAQLRGEVEEKGGRLQEVGRQGAGDGEQLQKQIEALNVELSNSHSTIHR